MREMERLRDLVGEIQDLRTTQGLLGWDLETHMPAKGSQIRGHQMATLAKLSHEMATSKEMGELLAKLREKKTYESLDRIDQAMVREVGKDYDRETKIRVELVQALTQTTTEAVNVWVSAREKDRFQDFAPILEKIVDLNRKMAEAIGYTGSPYNALLDLYEPGLTVEQLDPLFKNLRSELQTLLQAIQSSGVTVDARFMHKGYSTQKQVAFSEKVLKEMGYDFSAGRLDISAHPFSMGMGPGDVRLTTRVFPNDVFSCLSSAMHEGGHGLYEQGADPALARTSLEGGTSLGIHESQSRMWENLVGRSRPFWQHYFKELKKVFPRQLEGVTLDRFHRAINQVRPSAIRVESDEVTYNLHIVLRYEIEKDLIEGKLKVTDIPKAWNQKMTDYLGYTPQNDREGALQDVHWAHGSFGYFPTYTLGNLYSRMFYNAAKKQMPDLEERIAKGKLLPLKEWLNENIHRCGKAETPEEISRRVTGGPLKADDFIDYLWEKFGALYRIQRPVAAKR